MTQIIVAIVLLFVVTRTETIVFFALLNRRAVTKETVKTAKRGALIMYGGFFLFIGAAKIPNETWRNLTYAALIVVVMTALAFSPQLFKNPEDRDP